MVDFEVEKNAILEMETKIAEMKKKVQSAKKDLEIKGNPKGLLKALVTNHPITSIKDTEVSGYGRQRKHKRVDLHYSTLDTGGSDSVWNACVKLACAIHRDCYIEQRKSDGFLLFCYDTPKLSDLNRDQLEQSAKMIDEICSVYNRYFIQNHKIEDIPTKIVGDD